MTPSIATVLIKSSTGMRDGDDAATELSVKGVLILNDASRIRAISVALKLISRLGELCVMVEGKSYIFDGEAARQPLTLIVGLDI